MHKQFKKGLLLTATLLLIISLFGCINNNKVKVVESKQASFSPTSSQEVSDAILQTINNEDLILLSNEKISLQYDFDMSMLDECIVYLSKTENKCDEVAVFKLKDKNYSDTVISAINERIDLKKKTFTSINSSEYDKLQNPILINNNGFIVLVISDKNESVNDALNQFYK